MNKKEAKSVRVGQAVIEKKSNVLYYVEKIKRKPNEEFEFECSDFKAPGKKFKFKHADVKEAPGVPDKVKEEPKTEVKEEPVAVKAEVKPEPKPADPKKEEAAKDPKPRAHREDPVTEIELDEVYSAEDHEKAKHKNTANLVRADNHAIFQISEKEFVVKEVGSKTAKKINSSSLNNAKKIWNARFK